MGGAESKCTTTIKNRYSKPVRITVIHSRNGGICELHLDVDSTKTFQTDRGLITVHASANTIYTTIQLATLTVEAGTSICAEKNIHDELKLIEN
jgi:hypothetical protein